MLDYSDMLKVEKENGVETPNDIFIKYVVYTNTIN